jgi:hypothetical protein
MVQKPAYLYVEIFLQLSFLLVIYGPENFMIWLQNTYLGKQQPSCNFFTLRHLLLVAAEVYSMHNTRALF